jgi:Ribbon-helix-helix protein, copG family
MSHTISIRVSEDLAAWLEDAAAKSGVSKGKLVRDQLEKARNAAANRGFMRRTFAYLRSGARGNRLSSSGLRLGLGNAPGRTPSAWLLTATII